MGSEEYPRYCIGQVPGSYTGADISLDLVAIGGDVIEVHYLLNSSLSSCFWFTIEQVVSPFKPNTTAGRLLSKRGDGGYMIIMQNTDAAARRSFIESRGLSKVIFSHEHDDHVCIQYHPKGIPGMGPLLPSLYSRIHYPNESHGSV